MVFLPVLLKKDSEMEIKRDKYINDLKIRMNNGAIKVITGLRRVGKSYILFKLFRNYLIELGIPDDRIIGIALDDDQNESLRDADALSKHIRSLVKDKTKEYYVFLDEIQLAITEDELKNNSYIKVFSVLNGLLHLENIDIYVTGSNSKFLSSDILTEFRGRGDEIHVLPLTFEEFMQAYDGDIYHGWAEYITYGGLPFTLTMQTDEQKAKYLQNLFKETYMKDILSRNKISKSQELDSLIDILASSIGSLTNPNKLENTFKSVIGSSISANTIVKYISILQDAFIVSEASRYDIKGKKHIGAIKKYYFEDVGLRNARLNFRQIEENHIMENVIYNELRYRGYNVDVGIVEKREPNHSAKRVYYEVDFVANKGSRRYYIQSALSISDIEKEKQESNSLNSINDNFGKLIVVKDVVKPHMNDDGILTVGLFDFLLDKEILRF